MGLNTDKRVVRVVAAIIRRGNEIFATQRGYGAYKDWWEFPGGKIEAGETEIKVESFLTTVEYDYPEFYLIMDCFWCSVEHGDLKLLEHEAARWLPLDGLLQVNWLPADIEVIDAIQNCSC